MVSSQFSLASISWNFNFFMALNNRETNELVPLLDTLDGVSLSGVIEIRM